MRTLVLALALSGCAHATGLELDPPWTAPETARFFVIGGTQVPGTPPGLVERVVASTRGGLTERGFSARSGFASADEAAAAMRVARCDEQCVLVEVQITAISNARPTVTMALLPSSDPTMGLDVSFRDASGAVLGAGRMVAAPFADFDKPDVGWQIVPTIGPTIAGAIVRGP